MTENETIELLKGMQNSKVDYADLVGAEPFARGHKYVYPEPEDYAIEEAIIALKKIQQYREIGTVEECKTLVSIVNKAERDNLAKIIDEWLKYSKIGTVEECREAVERQKAKKIVYESKSVFSDGFSHYRMGKCPMCDRYYKSNDEVNYCHKCGHAIRWDMNSEEMEYNGD